MTYDSTNEKIVATPTTSSHIGTYNILHTQTPAKGTVDDFVGAVITIECDITAIAAPTPPSTGLGYSLYSSTHIIDLASLVYQ